MNQKLKKDGNRNTGKYCNSRPGIIEVLPGNDAVNGIAGGLSVVIVEILAAEDARHGITGFLQDSLQNKYIPYAWPTSTITYQTNTFVLPF